MMEQLQNAMAKLAVLDEVRDALFETLSTEQQMAVSRKLVVGKKVDMKILSRWMLTPEGTSAVREFVDKFAADK